MKPIDEDSLHDLIGDTETTEPAADVDAGLAAELRLTRSLLTRYPPPAEPIPAVLVVQPGVAPRWVPLLQSAVTIGRHPASDLVIDEPGVSREHCRLRFAKAAWSVEDLSSHNGTCFRDRRVRQLELRSGDVLRLGPVLILFTDGLRWLPQPASEP